MCGIVSRPIAAMRWTIWLIDRFILRLCGLYGLIIELGQHLALWIDLCVATATNFSLLSSTLFHLLFSVFCAALSLCFCFFRLLAVAISLLWRFSSSSCLSGMMCSSSSRLFSSPETGWLALRLASPCSDSGSVL